MLVLKGLIIYNLGYIAYQDLKSREVYWFLFLSLIILMGLQHYLQVLPIHFINAILINLVIIFIIIALQYIYTIIKIKRPFFKEVFGLGDALFFVSMAIAFPTITFNILFAFSLFFSLSIWLIFKNKSFHQNPPLAGYMAIFLLLIFIGSWSTHIINLYLI
ncbi:hypothetical protein [Aquimarina sp. RZ0]|uniref:hypothetical protein n=1 Tax=Aquimarina sp. RZ0 TaxID=2607730 RepID=UPI0011F1EE77|nr:hypothetical protein [Aquimarina sp. RZ0]KAA1247611.1 hypothetical protein F0000_02045 [Aquimarina sp. RZ0]